jgi:hypothetical protein
MYFFKWMDRYYLESKEAAQKKAAEAKEAAAAEKRAVAERASQEKANAAERAVQERAAAAAVAEAKRVEAQERRAAAAEAQQRAADERKAAQEAAADQRRQAQEQKKAAEEAKKAKAQQQKAAAAAAAQMKRQEAERKKAAVTNAAEKKKAAALKAEQAQKSVQQAKPRATISLFGLGRRTDDDDEPVSARKPAPSKRMSSAPRGVPTISGWAQNRDGSVSGKIFGSSSFSDGESITTSPISTDAAEGVVVQTSSGSKYVWKCLIHDEIIYLMTCILIQNFFFCLSCCSLFSLGTFWNQRRRKMLLLRTK